MSSKDNHDLDLELYRHMHNAKIGKTGRVFSAIQRRVLENRFRHQKYISNLDSEELADQLGLDDSQVRNNNLETFIP